MTEINSAAIVETLDEALADREQFKADYLRACRTIAEMHAAATGRTGAGPIRGVVEDVADLRSVYLLAEQRIAELERLATKLVVAIDLTRQYVGEECLPALPGWSWFDAVTAFETFMRESSLQGRAVPQ